MNRFRVVITEDDETLRISLRDWLSKNYIVKCFDSAESLLKAIHDFEFEDNLPTCILLDFQMPGMNGVELQKQLRNMHLEFPIIFMSGNSEQADIIDAWHGGAVDFLLKPFSVAHLNESLNSIFSKSEKIKSSMPLQYIQGKPAPLSISKREAEVLLLLGDGYRQNEIANILNVTLRTIKWHRSSIKNKLNLNTLVEVSKYCEANRSAIENIAQNSQ